METPGARHRRGEKGAVDVGNVDLSGLPSIYTTWSGNSVADETIRKDAAGTYTVFTVKKKDALAKPLWGFGALVTDIVELSGVAFLLGIWFLSFLAPAAAVALLLLPGWRLLGLILAAALALTYVPQLHPSPRVRRWVRSIAFNWYDEFSLRTELSQQAYEEWEKPLMLCCCPHGAFALGYAALHFMEICRSFTFCYSTALHKAPIFRLIADSTGTNAGVNRADVQAVMSQKRNLAICPGGFEEASFTQYRREKIYILNRGGFLKYALRYGYDVVPAYCFGETSSHYNLQGMDSLRRFFTSKGLPFIITWGWWSTWIPFKHVKLNIVIGKPLRLPVIANPTAADVEAAHKMYLEALSTLFASHCQKFYSRPEQQKLELM